MVGAEHLGRDKSNSGRIRCRQNNRDISGEHFEFIARPQRAETIRHANFPTSHPTTHPKTPANKAVLEQPGQQANGIHAAQANKPGNQLITTTNKPGQRHPQRPTRQLQQSVSQSVSQSTNQPTKNELTRFVSVPRRRAFVGRILLFFEAYRYF